MNNQNTLGFIVNNFQLFICWWTYKNHYKGNKSVSINFFYEQLIIFTRLVFNSSLMSKLDI